MKYFATILFAMLLISCESDLVSPTQPDFKSDGVWQSYIVPERTFYPMMVQFQGSKGQGQFSDQLYPFEVTDLLYVDNDNKSISFNLVFNFYGVGEIKGQFFGNVVIVNEAYEIHGLLNIPALQILTMTKLKQQSIKYLPKNGIHNQGGVNQGY